MKSITKLSVLLVCVILGIACTKETPTPTSTYQGGAAGFSLPAEMKNAEVEFYRNVAENDATCEGLFAVITNDNENYVLEIKNAPGDPLLQNVEMGNKAYIIDFEFLQASYTCYEAYGKSGSPNSDTVIQVDVEQVIISKIQPK